MNRDLVLTEWRRAGMALRAAQLLTAENYPEDAASRAYYAILHADKVTVHSICTASCSTARWNADPLRSRLAHSSSVYARIDGTALEAAASI